MKSAEKWWDEFRIGNSKSGPEIIREIQRDACDDLEATRAFYHRVVADAVTARLLESRRLDAEARASYHRVEEEERGMNRLELIEARRVRSTTPSGEDAFLRHCRTDVADLVRWVRVLRDEIRNPVRDGFGMLLRSGAAAAAMREMDASEDAE